MGKSGATHGGLSVGAVLMIFAALFYGATSISIKLVVAHLTVWQTAIGRFALGALLIPLIAWRTRLDIVGRNRGLLILRGVSATCSFLLLIQALRMIPLSICMILFYMWPVFACLLSPMIAGEPIGKQEWPFVAGALVGMVIILWSGKASAGLSPGHLVALGAAFSAGLAIILIRRLGRTNNAFTIYLYFCVIGGLVCITPLMTQSVPVLPGSVAGWGGLTAVAVFSLAGQVLMNQGLKTLNVSRTGVIMMIEPLFAAAFGAVYLHEPLTLRLLCGAGLILGCSVALLFTPTASFRPSSTLPLAVEPNMPGGRRMPTNSEARRDRS